MSYKTGGTGKGDAVRQGLNSDEYEKRMEILRNKPKVEKAKEVTKKGNITSYKF
jgi:hypothetical protein